jgi:hypothetical protein
MVSRWARARCVLAGGHRWVCGPSPGGKVVVLCLRCLVSTDPVVLPRTRPHVSAAALVRKLWAREPITEDERAGVDPMELARLSLTLLSIPAVTGDPGPLLDVLETARLDVTTWGGSDE